MRLGLSLVLVSLTLGLVFAGTSIHPAAACSSSFKLTVSPTSETITRGSNFKFTIFPTGPKCLTGIHVLIGASISPSLTNGPSFRLTGYNVPINVATPLLVGSTNSTTPTVTYTFTITARGDQAPIVGVVQTTTATLMVE